jgi:hypothetical protein
MEQVPVVDLNVAAPLLAFPQAMATPPGGSAPLVGTVPVNALPQAAVIVPTIAVHTKL